MGLLQFLMPMMSFVGGLFWSVIVDRTGSYRGTLTSTSLLGVVAVFGYLLPQIGHNLPLLLVITLLHGFLGFANRRPNRTDETWWAPNRP